MRLISAVVAFAAFLPSTSLLARAQDGRRPGADVEARDQFDFWVGAWDIVNRRLQEDGSWQEFPASAMIEEALSGDAIVERWVSRTDAWPMRGFSMRMVDAKTGLWTIALCWPSPAGNTAKFSFMEGSLSDGRGAFFPRRDEGDDTPARVRFTFSEITETSLQWDQAVRTEDGDWHTTWIMEWTRRDADDPIDEAWLNGAADEVRGAPGARTLDWLVGDWVQSEGPGRGLSTIECDVLQSGFTLRFRHTQKFRAFADMRADAQTGTVTMSETDGLLAWDANDGVWRYLEGERGGEMRVYAGSLVGDTLTLTNGAGDIRMVLARLENGQVRWRMERTVKGEWIGARESVYARQDAP